MSTKISMAIDDVIIIFFLTRLWFGQSTNSMAPSPHPLALYRGVGYQILMGGIFPTQFCKGIKRTKRELNWKKWHPKFFTHIPIHIHISKTICWKRQGLGFRCGSACERVLLLCVNFLFRIYGYGGNNFLGGEYDRRQHKICTLQSGCIRLNNQDNREISRGSRDWPREISKPKGNLEAQGKSWGLRDISRSKEMYNSIHPISGNTPLQGDEYCQW